MTPPAKTTRTVGSMIAFLTVLIISVNLYVALTTGTAVSWVCTAVSIVCFVIVLRVRSRTPTQPRRDT